MLKRLFRKRRQDDRQTGEEGFSLTEIMVAVFIMGLLATVVLINVLPARDTAMVSKAKTDIRAFEAALEQYRLDMLDYPSTEQGLEALIEPPTNSERAERYRQGGYLTRSALPKDPWGNEYQYQYPGEHARVDIYSLGADGRPGGEELNADVGNWEE